MIHDGNHLPMVTVSLGVAADDEQGECAELLARADRALYAAKQAGRNRTQCAP
jgi:diguanylate cyclase (GGDEF)-like protein